MFKVFIQCVVLRYQGQCLSLWDSYGLANYEMRSGAFSEDAKGRWYLNVTVDVKKPALAPASERSQFAALQSSAVGVDLGLKDLLALSNGEKVPSQQFYRDLESPLAAAQRAGHKQRVKNMRAGSWRWRWNLPLRWRVKQMMVQQMRNMAFQAPWSGRAWPSGSRNPCPLGRGGCQF